MLLVRKTLQIMNSLSNLFFNIFKVVTMSTIILLCILILVHAFKNPSMISFNF